MYINLLRRKKYYVMLNHKLSAGEKVGLIGSNNPGNQILMKPEANSIHLKEMFILTI